MNDKYILDGHTPVICNNLMEWAEWMEKGDRVVAKTNIGEVRVSTVFLGIDHNYLGDKPLLFETMIFGGKYDEEMQRYSTWDEAEKGHRKMTERVLGI